MYVMAPLNGRISQIAFGSSPVCVLLLENQAPGGVDRSPSEGEGTEVELVRLASDGEDPGVCP